MQSLQRVERTLYVAEVTGAGEYRDLEVIDDAGQLPIVVGADEDITVAVHGSHRALDARPGCVGVVPPGPVGGQGEGSRPCLYGQGGHHAPVDPVDGAEQRSHQGSQEA